MRRLPTANADHIRTTDHHTPDKQPFMTVNGVRKEIDPGRGTVPVIVNSRTLVPIRPSLRRWGQH